STASAPPRRNATGPSCGDAGSRCCRASSVGSGGFTARAGVRQSLRRRRGRTSTRSSRSSTWVHASRRSSPPRTCSPASPIHRCSCSRPTGWPSRPHGVSSSRMRRRESRPPTRSGCARSAVPPPPRGWRRTQSSTRSTASPKMPSRSCYPRRATEDGDMTDERSGTTTLSPWWRHAAILVMIAGFTILSIATVETYNNAPPIPARVVDEAGGTVFTRDDVLRGQEVFFKYGLMEHGSLWGHGAYLGPDYSAEYLHRLAEIAHDTLARERYGAPYATLEHGRAPEIAEQVRGTLKTNRYDPASDTLRFSPGEVVAFETQRGEWGNYFSGKDPAPGLPSAYIKHPEELASLAAYFAWASWATVADRPGKDYSYTNNWPYEPLVGNVPSASTYLWSGLSLITLLGAP